VVKLELHSHTDEDPADRVTHSTRELIDRAASLGYGALAITLHDRYFDPAPHADYARDRGIVLIAGIERNIGRHHILLINFPAACAAVRDFDDIAKLKRQCGGLVVAPHPFYPIRSALGSALDRHAAVVDAVEINSMYTRFVNFNRRAIRWARAHDKTLVGNTDLHLLDQMGTTYSLVDAEPQADAICDAIRARRSAHRAAVVHTRDAALFRHVLGRAERQISSVGRLSGRHRREHLVDSLDSTT
jgi:predicted metal-dependent phosphoesterase TrpH